MSRAPYPHRAGSSVASWRAHILDVLAWKAERYGVPVWDAHDDDLGVRGATALAELELDGLVTATRRVEYHPAYRGTDYFGRGSGYVRPRHVEHIRIERVDA